MLVRVKIPQPLFLCSWSEGELEGVSASFVYKHYAITLTLEGGEAKKATWAKPDDYTKWYRESTHALLVIKETERSPRSISNLIAPPVHEDLLDLIEEAAMKAIRVLRNVGYVPELPESLPRNEPIEEILRSWKPEMSSDGATWDNALPPVSDLRYRSLFGLAGRSGFASGFPSKPEMQMRYWSRIQEVLEDNLEIAPEDEFLTNTIGHLRTRNFCLAIVDAVIGLEIVLAKYLRSYLAIAKKIPNTRIKSFLRNDFGLTQRLEGLLDLTMHESYLKDVKLDQVLKAVNWRNQIAHKTGQLPADVPVATVREYISAVLDLARTLAELYVNISASPDRERIGEKLKTNWSERIGWPQLWIKPWHKVYGEIGCGIGAPLTREEMNAIATELGGYLKARDKRFDPTSDLHVKYKYFMGDPIGTYIFGQVFLEGELPKIPSPEVTSASANSVTPPSSAGNSEVSAS